MAEKDFSQLDYSLFIKFLSTLRYAIDGTSMEESGDKDPSRVKCRLSGNNNKRREDMIARGNNAMNTYRL